MSIPVQCTRKRCVLPGVTKKDATPHRPWVETASSILEANPPHPGAIYIITGTTMAERTSVSQYLQQKLAEVSVLCGESQSLMRILARQCKHDRNVPRSVIVVVPSNMRADCVNWSDVTRIKDGRLRTENGWTRFYDRPHVFIFTDGAAPLEKLTGWKWRIVRVDEHGEWCDDTKSVEEMNELVRNANINLECKPKNKKR